MWTQIVNALIGIWLMVSPPGLGYTGLGADSNRITGPIITTIAVVAAWEATRGLGRLNLIPGLWLVLAPWILGYESTLPIVNDILCGFLVSVLSLVRGKIHNSYGGGWKALWQNER